MVAVSSSLPVASTTATLQPVRMPGSRPSTAFGPAGAASNSSCRLRPNILIASASAASRNCASSSVLRCECALTRQVQWQTSASHLSARRPRSSMPKCAAIIATQGCGTAASSSSPRPSSIFSTPRLSAAEQRQRAMRGDGADGFGIGIVVAELFFLGRFLAFHHRGRDDALLPQARTQFGEQLGGLGKTLAQECRARHRARLWRRER